jgi:tape measure domain-containing protein
MIAGILEIQMLANMARLSDDMRRAERVVGDSMNKIERSVASAQRAMSSLGMGLGIGLVADQMRRTADAYTKMDAQIRLSTKSQQGYNQALTDIRRISTIAQSDISATTMLYTRLLNTTEGMGISQAKLATVTETVSFGLKAYGATSAEAASAALQLSQAMGANRLGGEEFRAVMEAMPNVMKVVANSMGVPLGALRQLSIDGKITADVLVKALGDPAIAAQFKQMAEATQTITGAWTVARNELTLLFGEFATASGSNSAIIASFKLLSESIKILAGFMNELVAAFMIYISVVSTKFVMTTLEAVAAQSALTAAHGEALAMNVVIARSEMANALAARDVAAARAWQTGVTTGLTAANARLAASSAAVASATELQAAGSMSLFARLKSTVGTAGIVGLILFGIYELADVTGFIDRIFGNLNVRIDAFTKKIAEMSLETAKQEQAAAQAEVERAQAAQRKKIERGFGFGTEKDLSEALQKKRIIDAKIEALESAHQVKLESTWSGATDAFNKFHMTKSEKYRAEKAELDKLYLANVDAALAQNASSKVQIELADKYAVKLADLSDKEKKQHESTMLRIYSEMDAKVQSDDTSLNNSERVSLAWTKLKSDEKTAQEALNYVMAQEVAISLDQRQASIEADKARVKSDEDRKKRIQDAFDSHQKFVDDVAKAEAEDTKRIASSISVALVKGVSDNRGMFASVRDIIREELIDKPIQKEMTVVVSAGVDWVKALVANTLATEKNTGAQGASGTSGAIGTVGTGAMYAVAAYTVFKSAQSLGLLGSFDRSSRAPQMIGTASRGGFAGRMAQVSGENRGAFGGGTVYTTRYSELTQQQQKMMDTSIKSFQTVYDTLGSAIGDLSIRTRKWSFELNSSGDDIAALASGMADALIPALQQFRKEGENLIQTAQRLTTLFNSTSSLIVALGVSQQDAFGTIGIASTDARQRLIDAAGGLDAFNSKAGFFVNTFLTDAQKLQPALDSVGRTFYELGITGIETNKQFADRVALELKLGNYETVNRLLSVADAFNTITASTVATTNALKNLLNINAFSTLQDYIRATVTAAQNVAPKLTIAGATGAATIAGATAAAGTALETETAANISLSRQILKAKALNVISQGIGWEEGVPEAGIPSYDRKRMPLAAYMTAARATYESLPAFANGGVFTNGIFNTPTPFMFANGGGFSAGVMGEAGDEAVMPLQRGSDGRLGVSMSGGGEVAAEIRALRDEVAMLRSDNRAGQVAIATATQRTYKVINRWNGEGLPDIREVTA